MATRNESMSMAQDVLQQQLAEKYFEPDVTINMDRLNGPAFLTTLFLWPGKWSHQRIVWQQVCREGQSLGRPLAQPEVDALSEIADWQFRFRGWGQPLSILCTLFFVWKGRATYKIAFRPLRADINPDVFPSAKRQWFNGQRARYAWRATQFLSYAPASWLFTAWMMNETALAKGQTMRRQDQRLAQLNAERKANVQAELQKRFQHMQERQAQGAPMHGSGGTRPQPRPPLLEAKKPGEYTDDASPVSSNARDSDWGNAGAMSASTASTSSSYPSSSASPYPQQQQTSSSPSYQAPQASDGPNGAGGWDNSPSAFDSNDDDDMSPVSPAARRHEAAAGTSGGGSAWERLRKQSAPQNVQQQQQPNETSNWGSNSNTSSSAGAKPGGWGAIRQQNQSSTAASTGDSYTFSEADEHRENRNYEREKAQKEFDEMVERERQGKGVSGGSGGSGGSGSGWFGRS